MSAPGASTTMPSACHVGLMIPANNTTLEREILAWLPPGSSCTTKRIPRGKGLLTPETLPAYRAEALRLAAELADPAVDVVAYGCTAAGFILGPAGDRALAADLARVTGKPVVTIAQSMVRALQRIGARRIALVTPYSDAVNDRLKDFLSDGGIGVQRFDSFYAPDVDALGRITGPEVDLLARKTMTDDCDAMFIACAQLPTHGILDGLRSAFGRPVLSSNEVISAAAQFAAESAVR